MQIEKNEIIVKLYRYCPDRRKYRDRNFCSYSPPLDCIQSAAEKHRGNF